jgi:hypothetical protein
MENRPVTLRGVATHANTIALAFPTVNICTLPLVKVESPAHVILSTGHATTGDPLRLPLP